MSYALKIVGSTVVMTLQRGARARRELCVRGQDRAIADDDARTDDRVRIDPSAAADDRVLHGGAGADHRLGPDDRAVDRGVLTHDRRPANDTVCRDPGAIANPGTGADETGPLQLGSGMERRRGVDHRLADSTFVKRRCRAPAGHDVAMGLDICFRRADVEPVFAADMRDERLSALHERGK